MVRSLLNRFRSRSLGSFLSLVYHRFNRDGCILHATTLSFTTLLSLVPLITVSIAILAAFPVFDKMVVQVQDYFFTHFYPKTASVQEVQKYVMEFTGKAKQLTATGIGFLIITALLLMQSIDQSLNAVWHIRQRRRVLSSFLVYWAVLTIGPVLMGISIAVTSYLVSLPLVSKTFVSVGIREQVLAYVPFFTTMVAFTLMYMIVPNRPVLFRHAIIGGLVGSILFELAKKGFAVYVTTFPGYKNIYGTLSTIPIFMVWIYISWIIVLLGAEITRCLALFQSDHVRGGASRIALIDLLEIIRLLDKARETGQTLKNRHLLKDIAGLSDDQLITYLDELKNGQVIDRTDNGNWVLIRDLDHFTLKDLYNVYPSVLPGDQFDESKMPERYRSLLEHLRDQLQASMGISLKELCRQ